MALNAVLGLSGGRRQLGRVADLFNGSDFAWHEFWQSVRRTAHNRFTAENTKKISLYRLILIFHNLIVNMIQIFELLIAYPKFSVILWRSANKFFKLVIEMAYIVITDFCTYFRDAFIRSD